MLAIVILSKFPTSFSKLKNSLISKCEELSNKKLDNNDAWRLASLSFTISGATSSKNTNTCLDLHLIHARTLNLSHDPPNKNTLGSDSQLADEQLPRSINTNLMRIRARTTLSTCGSTHNRSNPSRTLKALSLLEKAEPVQVHYCTSHYAWGTEYVNARWV